MEKRSAKAFLLITIATCSAVWGFSCAVSERGQESPELTRTHTAVTALRNLLRSGNSEDRISAIRSLQALESLDAEEPVVDALLSDPDKEVRIVAARSIGSGHGFLSPVQTEALVAALNDPDEKVRHAVFNVLEEASLGFRFADPANVIESLITRLDETCCDTYEHQCIASILRNFFGGSVLSRMMDALDKGNRWTKRCILKAIGPVIQRTFGHIRSQAIDKLIHISRSSGETELRIGAIQALSLVGGREAGDLFLELLESESPAIREQAMIGLGRIGDRRAVEPLKKMVASEDSRVRQAALFSLSDLSPDGVTDILIDRLVSDADEGVRRQAARNLMEHPTKSAVKPLLDALRNSADPKLKEYCLMALIRVGGREVVDSLIELIEEGKQDADFVAWICSSLAQIGSERAITYLLENTNRWEKIKENMPYALGRSKDPRVTPYLIDGLESDDVWMRSWATHWLRNSFGISLWKEFGYTYLLPEDERKASIEKIRKWWENIKDKGKSR